ELNMANNIEVFYLISLLKLLPITVVVFLNSLSSRSDILDKAARVKKEEEAVLLINIRRFLQCMIAVDFQTSAQVCNHIAAQRRPKSENLRPKTLVSSFNSRSIFYSLDDVNKQHYIICNVP
ncbi:hypothetical protein L9F63_015011, partial [Diploptera punctata]